MRPTNSYIHDSTIALTQHSRKRARERLGWTPSTLQRMSKKAFESGLEKQDTNGHLKKYLDRLSNNQDQSINLRLYGETLFIFSNKRLITMWHLPGELRPLAKAIRLKVVKSKCSD